MVERRDSPPRFEYDVFIILNQGGGWLGTRVHLSEDAARRWVEDRGFVLTDMNLIVPARLIIDHKWFMRERRKEKSNASKS
jgi:hypothetical protein